MDALAKQLAHAVLADDETAAKAMYDWMTERSTAPGSVSLLYICRSRTEEAALVPLTLSWTDVSKLMEHVCGDTPTVAVAACVHNGGHACPLHEFIRPRDFVHAHNNTWRLYMTRWELMTKDLAAYFAENWADQTDARGFDTVARHMMKDFGITMKRKGADS